MSAQPQGGPQEPKTSQQAGATARKAATAVRDAWDVGSERATKTLGPAWQRRPRLSGLGRAVATWLLVAAAVFTLLGWLWGSSQHGFWHRLFGNWSAVVFDSVSPVVRVIVSLGILLTGCAVALVVISFKERSAAEQRAAEERLVFAVDRLGSSSPQVRIAAVYALAEAADKYKGGYRQRVVDILCGYLRTERGVWEEQSSPTRGRRARSQRHYLSQDAAVESTVLSVLARHLQKLPEEPEVESLEPGALVEEQMWSDCHIDLRGATLVSPAVFKNTVFRSPVDFTGTTFVAGADFSGASFTQDAAFSKSAFRGPTVFQGADFAKMADFSQSLFTEVTDFSGAGFNWYASFKDASFLESLVFEQSYLANTDGFTGAVFNRRLRTEGSVRFSLRGATHFKDPTGLPFGARWASFERSDRQRVAPPPPNGTLDGDSTADAAG